MLGSIFRIAVGTIIGGLALLLLFNIIYLIQWITQGV